MFFKQSALPKLTKSLITALFAFGFAMNASAQEAQTEEAIGELKDMSSTTEVVEKVEEVADVSAVDGAVTDKAKEKVEAKAKEVVEDKLADPKPE